MRQRLAGAHGAMARQRIGGAIAPRFHIAALRHLIQHIHKRLGGICVRQYDRRSAHQIDIAAERLDEQSQLSECMLLRFRYLLLARVEFDGKRLQQALRLRRSGCCVRHDALEHHALVRGVLVNQIHAVRTLGDYVGIMRLPQHSQRGQRLLVREGGAFAIPPLHIAVSAKRGDACAVRRSTERLHAPEARRSGSSR